MNLKELLQKQGEIYSNLTSNETIETFNEKVEKPPKLVPYKGYQIPEQGYKMIKGLEKFLGIEPVIVDEPTVSWNFEISIEKNQIIYLRIFGQNIEEIPKSIKNLTNLKLLNLGFNQIKKIKNLDNLQNLKELDLHFNRITELKGLDNLQNLQKLGIWNNKLWRHPISNWKRKRKLINEGVEVHT